MTDSEQIRASKPGSRPPQIALFTGGIDKHYANGLCQSLATRGIAVEMICNSETITDETRKLPGVRLLSLYETFRGRQTRFRKVLGVLGVYVQLIRYATGSSAPVFHILWNYKFPLFDRTLLLLYYKAIGKRLVFTAHNVNAGARDGANTLLNRLSLRAQYRYVDRIFVHTEKMKREIVDDFGGHEEDINVIPFGTYDVVPQTTLTSEEAKQRLGLRQTDRTLLFFGRILPYKGIDLLVNAFLRIAPKDPNYRLVVAGEPMKEGERQWREVQQRIEQSPVREQVVQHIGYIEDREIEIFFKGADVLVLPYKQIFQSGVLFMSYSFGLPVIATDIGSFGQDVISGTNGYVCRPNDPQDLARAIEEYFSSRLFQSLAQQRAKIKMSIQKSHSWEIASAKTSDVYAELLSNTELKMSRLE